MSGNSPVPPPNHPKPQPAPNSARYELVDSTGLQGAPFLPAPCVVDGVPVPVSSQQLGQPAPADSQEVPGDHLPPPPPPPSPPPESPSNDALALAAIHATLDVLPLAMTIFHIISSLEADDAQVLFEALSQWIAHAPEGHPPPPPVTPPPKPPKYGDQTSEQTHTLVALFPGWAVRTLGPGGYPPPPPPTPPPKAPKQGSLVPQIAQVSSSQHAPPPPPTPPPKELKQKQLVELVSESNGQHPPPPPPTPPPKAPNQKQLVELLSQLGGHPPPPPVTPPPKPPKYGDRLRIQLLDGHAPKPVPPVPNPDPVPAPRSLNSFCAAELGPYVPVRAHSTVALVF